MSNALGTSDGSNPTIALVAEYPNHHQFPFALACRALLGERFRWVCIAPMWRERLDMRWEECGSNESWVLRRWEKGDAERECDRWAEEADVAIVPTYWSNAPAPRIVRARSSRNRLTLVYSEPRWRSYHPGVRLLLAMLKHRLSARSIDVPCCHYLSVGAYAAGDEARIGMFRNRAWTFGYFVPVPSEPPLRRADGPMRVLWAGRMIDWKQVDVLLRALAPIVAEGGNVELDLIGDGPLRNQLQALARRLGLEHHTRFLGMQMPHAVVDAMRSAHVFVLPSSYREGWGVVLGEAMAQGCAVITTVEAGASLSLVTNGVNGLHVSSGDVQQMTAALRSYVANPQRVANFGRAGWATMRSEWSPEVAAERILALCRGLLGREPLPHFERGVGSRAIIRHYARR